MINSIIMFLVPNIDTSVTVHQNSNKHSWSFLCDSQMQDIWIACQVSSININYEPSLFKNIRWTCGYWEDYENKLKCFQNKRCFGQLCVYIYILYHYATSLHWTETDRKNRIYSTYTFISSKTAWRTLFPGNFFCEGVQGSYLGYHILEFLYISITSVL